ncbi:MAG TPA: flavodoxin family protein [Candidatus Flavonifractor merdigallinarum]|uniref:Flavodoxin family protein n=1 Tax=Candidatus Flavonifractor merdigallinarum TaxID=2838589 RepID=A0A9D1Y7P5_9FIRM|nr:flavodoxin family protein [Candidatus Flavonifractor merdigallinarum]
MSKKVLVISTSLRPNSNSDVLAQQFVKGAQEAGHEVEYLSLRGKDLRFCTGCMACLKAPRCVIQDDANAIVEKMGAAEVICFATPVYYYEMSGQMKTLLDRANPLFSADYHFRDVYLLTASAEEEDSASDGPIHGLNGWIACFEKARLAGVVRGGGANDPGEMAPEKQKAAYELGKHV